MANCCSKYNARQLRHTVSFERQGETSDGAGGYTKSWSSISGAPTKGMIKALSGRERWASQRTEATSTYRLVTRYVSGITEKDSVVFDGRRFNITFVNNVDFMDDWLEIDLGLGVAV